MPATPTPDRRDLKAAFAKEGRLYGLGLVCAVPGALAVWRTDSVWIGVLVFLAVLGVAGSALFVYERRLKERRAAEDQDRGPTRGGTDRRATPGQRDIPERRGSPDRRTPSERHQSGPSQGERSQDGRTQSGRTQGGRTQGARGGRRPGGRRPGGRR